VVTVEVYPLGFSAFCLTMPRKFKATNSIDDGANVFMKRSKPEINLHVGSDIEDCEDTGERIKVIDILFP
jgi:hypothetical protein